MTSEIDALLGRVEDESLRAELRERFDRLSRKRQFGLVFEEHVPERVALPNHPIRIGSQVVPRADQDAEPRTVVAVDGAQLTLAADDDGNDTDSADAASGDDDAGGGPEQVAVDDVVAVAEFGEPIYPGLTRLGSVDRGGDKPAHVVIKGENHHALEALQFTHAGKVDCIYIDPPYNTGARDWKYNNDYVDGDDAYRHSKWLAMMQRRLLLARKLLNPENSVLIVTIDEKEAHKLGLLLDQTFPDADVQMVTAVTNHAGSSRPGRITRVDEYVFFAFVGRASTSAWTTNLLREVEEVPSVGTIWFSAIRTGPGSSLREARPNLFYPVFINKSSGDLESVGEPLAADDRSANADVGTDTLAIWPLASSGREQTWRFSAEKMREYLANGTARLGRLDPETGLRPVTYLRPGTLEKINDGTFVVTGRDEYGGLKVELGPGARSVTTPVSVWNMRSHFARDYGTKLNKRFIPGRDFPYPKSLFVTEDTLRVAIGGSPDAVVLDFFVGSGTTPHAVARLNRQDGGRRQSISVTNNEVSESESTKLASAGYRPGDPEWEAAGIFEHVTRPRITAAVTGKTPEGEPVKGDYKFTDEFPMAEGFEENVEFMELTYLDAEDVELDLAFTKIAPLLWMRAGSQGPVIENRTDADGDPLPYASTDRYAVLFDPDQWRAFVGELADTVTTVFVVTDSASVFAGVAAELPTGIEIVRLYENYLTTFTINQGGGG